MSLAHWSLHMQRRILNFHIYSNNDITYVLNKLVNTFYILMYEYVPFNLYRLLSRPTYALAFFGLDNNLVYKNLILYCTVYANTGLRPLVHQALAFEVWNTIMINKYYEICKVYNLRVLVQINSQSSKTCFARTSAVDYRRQTRQAILVNPPLRWYATPHSDFNISYEARYKLFCFSLWNREQYILMLKFPQ